MDDVELRLTRRLCPSQSHCEFAYDDIDFQHAIAEHQWYVSATDQFQTPYHGKVEKIFIKKILHECDLCF